MSSAREPLRRFVVLWHEVPPPGPAAPRDHRGSHFDLMLDQQTHLRTWALDRWPLRVGESCDVRALPDHRLRYLDYEGPISDGRGTVRRVERGRGRLLRDAPGGVILELRGEHFTGRLHIAGRRVRAEPLSPPSE